MLTTDEPLLHRARDPRGVVTLTLNRPQAFNALSDALLQALQYRTRCAGESTRRSECW